jgi:hypothetical protein
MRGRTHPSTAVREDEIRDDSGHDKCASADARPGATAELWLALANIM